MRRRGNALNGVAQNAGRRPVERITQTRDWFIFLVGLVILTTAAYAGRTRFADARCGSMKCTIFCKRKISLVERGICSINQNADVCAGAAGRSLVGCKRWVDIGFGGLFGSRRADGHAFSPAGADREGSHYRPSTGGMCGAAPHAQGSQIHFLTRINLTDRRHR
jgi:hypothetical protein